MHADGSEKRYKVHVDVTRWDVVGFAFCKSHGLLAARSSWDGMWKWGRSDLDLIVALAERLQGSLTVLGALGALMASFGANVGGDS